MSDLPNVIYHHDPELFQSAIRFTSARTGFSERLIEKDYYCSVMLDDLCPLGDSGLVFKGGTCLSKVHADFFRLSEDLDFGISTPTTASRIERSQRVANFKKHIAGLPRRHVGFRIDEPLTGYSTSTQYGGRLAYISVVTGQDEFITIEISVREPTVEPPAMLDAKTMLLDPFRGVPAVAPFKMPVLSLREAYAEKLRAALTRREPAIRDFFDLDHAISTGKVDITDPQLIQLLRIKLAIPGNDPVDISQEKVQRLREQIMTQLRPVLRAVDFDRFDLERAVDNIARIVQLTNS